MTDRVARDMLLMFADIPVMRINTDLGMYNVLSDKYLPYGLRGKLVEIPNSDNMQTTYERIQWQRAVINNYNSVVHWLADRTLLLSRANSKWIYNALNVPQKVDDLTRLKIAILCRDVSVLDKYWLKLDGDPIKWDDVNVKKNKLNEIIAQIALHGSAVTLCGSLVTPELTTNGAYAKAWRRHDDGQLWLHKLGHNGNMESKIEVAVSNILDKCNVPHVHYEAGEDYGKYVCMCPCMSTDNLSIVTADEFYSYCNVNKLNMDNEILKLDADNYYKMQIVDYLISNRDRHLQNWGFYMDNNTMQVVGLHPLFDHNNAFDIDWMREKDMKYLLNSKSIRETAMNAIKHVDFHFTDDIIRSDFITDRQYQSFTERARELGIGTVKSTSKSFDDAINLMSGK